jgi:hypothetical protein
MSLTCAAFRVHSVDILLFIFMTQDEPVISPNLILRLRVEPAALRHQRAIVDRIPLASSRM